jgi:TatA/E family protein of Tat protein translocase
MDLFAGHLPELIIVLVVILIIWGPGKLPDIGAAVGRGIREFRKASAETRDTTRNATVAPPSENPPVSQSAQGAPGVGQEPASSPEVGSGSAAGSHL